MNQDEFFFRLTPDTVLDAVEAVGLRPTGGCLQLNSLENRVYDLAMDDGSHVVAKFYRPGRWSWAQVAQEHEFLFDLQEREVPVCAPVQVAGESIWEIEGIMYAVWPRTG